MDELEEILRRNPKAAKDIKSIKKAIAMVKKLRAAGVGGDGYTLLPPFGGRRAFGKVLAPRAERTKVVSKMTFGA